MPMPSRLPAIDIIASIRCSEINRIASRRRGETFLLANLLIRETQCIANFRLMKNLIGFLAEERIDESLRVERFDILRRFAEADEFYGNIELFLDRHHHAALCGSIQFCKHDA